MKTRAGEGMKYHGVKLIGRVNKYAT